MTITRASGSTEPRWTFTKVVVVARAHITELNCSLLSAFVVLGVSRERRA
jgi:hypothetical protein